MGRGAEDNLNRGSVTLEVSEKNIISLWPSFLQYFDEECGCFLSLSKKICLSLN